MSDPIRLAEGESVPPPLPPRHSATRELPPLPQRDLPELPSRKASNSSNPLSPSSTFSSETAATNLNTLNSGPTYNYDLNDNLSTILVLRQFEVLNSPALNESSDFLTYGKTASDDYKSRFDGIRGNGENASVMWEFWSKVVLDYKSFISSRNFLELETVFIEGIPSQLRTLVYQSLLHINSTLSTANFNALLDRFSSTESMKNQNFHYENLKFDGRVSQALKVFNCYISATTLSDSQIDLVNTTEDTAGGILPSNFMINICKLVLEFDGITVEESIPILLKWHRLFDGLIKEEFFYKINRSFEDNIPLLFIHLTKQGISLTELYKIFIFNFFNTKIADSSILLKILDITLIEGLDFLIRFILLIFDKNSDNLSKLNFNELSTYINGEELFSFVGFGFKLSDALKFSPNLIKYENEYHLIHNNSLNLNENELTKLKEVNDDLKLKINELSTNFENLNNSHLQILKENEIITTKQNKVKAQNEILNKEKQELLGRIRTLDMHEEITYTVKRNEEIELMNQELQAHIDQVKETIAKKKERLEQFEAAAVV